MDMVSNESETGLTPTVHVEFIGGAIGTVHVGSLSIDEPPGSMSDEPPGGSRRVLIFGWVDERPGVWESAGIDVANSAVREIHSVKLTQLSDLSEPFELLVYPPFIRKGDPPLRIRFTALGLVASPRPEMSRTLKESH